MKLPLKATVGNFINRILISYVLYILSFLFFFPFDIFVHLKKKSNHIRDFQMLLMKEMHKGSVGINIWKIMLCGNGENDY